MATTAKTEFHPLSEAFPLLEGDEFERFADDIKENGLRDPIVLLDMKILEGRNRYRACLARDVEPRYEDLPDGEDPTKFVISKNLHRRHLDASQRALVAARLANMEPFRPKLSAQICASQDEAAQLLNVSRRSVQVAAVVDKAGSAAVVHAVERGDVSVSDAAAIVDLPKSEQNEALKKVQEGKADTLREATGRKKPSTNGKLHQTDATENILCDRCQRVGAIDGCNQCKEARQAAKEQRKKAREARKDAPSEVTDAFGNVVPKGCLDAWKDGWIQDTYDFLCTTSETFRKERLADGMKKRQKHYPFFDSKSFIDGVGFIIQYFDDLIKHVKEQRPAGVCPACQGKKCSECRFSGLVPRELYTTLKEANA